MDCRPKLWKRLLIMFWRWSKRAVYNNSPITSIRLNPLKTSSLPMNLKQTVKPPASKHWLLANLTVRLSFSYTENPPIQTNIWISISHHPLQHKLGVVKTLLDRAHWVVKDNRWQKERGKLHQESAWKMQLPELGQVYQDSTSKGMVIHPYIQGIPKRLQRVHMKHDTTMVHKPHSALRKHLVHPKDKKQTVWNSSCLRVWNKLYDLWDYLCRRNRKTLRYSTQRTPQTCRENLKVQKRASRPTSVSEPHKSAISDQLRSFYKSHHRLGGAKILHHED